RDYKLFPYKTLFRSSKLGPFVAYIKKFQNLDDYYNQYRQRVVVLLSHPANPRDHTNVLMHVQGYFRPH
ncbi:DUF1722 domain-containing protein, partial [Escherichia coli]|uniref:DUF1722 domain-containing protein n=1 Tax=Escherichia coli TaxID=562 RepID=UPI00298F1D1B